MTVVASEIVDWSALGEALELSVGIGLVVLLVAAIAVASSLRAVDAREAGGGATAAYSAVTVLCVGGLAAAIVTGIYFMTQK